MLAPHRGRIAWDEPIASAADVPDDAGAVNVKPARIGSLRGVLSVLDRCATLGIPTYGGGQSEIGPGRGQAQILAALFSPAAPNDLAPIELQRGRAVERTCHRARSSPSRGSRGFAGASATGAASRRPKSPFGSLHQCSTARPAAASSSSIPRDGTSSSPRHAAALPRRTTRRRRARAARSSARLSERSPISIHSCSGPSAPRTRSSAGRSGSRARGRAP